MPEILAVDVPETPKTEVPYLEQVIVGPDDIVVTDSTREDPKGGSITLTLGRMLYLALMLPRDEQVDTIVRVKRAKLARRIKLGGIKAFTTAEKTLLLERISIFDNRAVYGCVSLLDPAMLED